MIKEELKPNELKRLDEEIADAVQRIKEGAPKQYIPEEAPAVLLTEALLRKAALIGASDIHLTPTEEDVRVRFRLDGELEEVLRIPRSGYRALCTRLKVLADMNAAQSRLPQNGSLSFSYFGEEYDVRLSSFPTVLGANFVLTSLPRSCPYSREQLGCLPEEESAVRRMLSRPGLVLITGPTGSGKSTTLACFLKELSSKSQNIVTVEDPVEYRIEGVEQLSLSSCRALTLENALKDVLRQDPDIIMTGEIRDEETAGLTVRMALTGKLVLTTLHTAGAVGAVQRMRDLGIKDAFLADALSGVISQRLVKRLCPYCRTSVPTPPGEQVLLGVPKGTMRSRAASCEKCSGRGSAGRFAVHEVLEVTDSFREGIRTGRSTSELSAIAFAEGMKPMRERARGLLLKGEIDMEGYCSICGIPVPQKEE